MMLVITEDPTVLTRLCGGSERWKWAVAAVFRTRTLEGNILCGLNYMVWSYVV